MPLDTAGWGVDVVVVGSQKALALPPRLAFVSVSGRAWARIETARAQRFYFDVRRERKAQAGGEAAYTPPRSHVMALGAAAQVGNAHGEEQSHVPNANNL